MVQIDDSWFGTSVGEIRKELYRSTFKNQLISGLMYIIVKHTNIISIIYCWVALVPFSFAIELVMRKIHRMLKRNLLSCYSYMEDTQARFHTFHGIQLKNGSFPTLLKTTFFKCGRCQSTFTMMTMIHQQLKRFVSICTI